MGFFCCGLYLQLGFSLLHNNCLQTCGVYKTISKKKYKSPRVLKTNGTQVRIQMVLECPKNGTGVQV